MNETGCTSNDFCVFSENDVLWTLLGITLLAVVFAAAFFVRRAKRFRIKNALLRNRQQSNVILSEFVTLDNDSFNQRS